MPLIGLLVTTWWAGSPLLHSVAADVPPSPSAAVTASMQPYLDSYKLAGFIGVIADKTGQIQYRNIAGYADVEAKKPLQEDNVFGSRR